MRSPTRATSSGWCSTRWWIRPARTPSTATPSPRRRACCGPCAAPAAEPSRATRWPTWTGSSGAWWGGRRRPARLTRGELFLIFLTGDVDPALRGAFPGAVRAALDGDTAPILRLKRRALTVATPPPPHVFSTAVFTATTCEEAPLPWPRLTPPDPLERRRQTEVAVNATPSSAFLPFDRGAALENDLPQLCDRWAAAPVPPDFGPGPLPDVPVLLVEGEDDLRTPVENARRVAALFPQAQLVVASATGHSALSSDQSGCTARALARFFRDRPVAGGFRPGPP